MPATVNSRTAAFTLRLEDADAEDQRPLPHARVMVEGLDAAGKPVGVLFRGRSNAEGQLRLGLSRLDGQGQVRVRLRVLDLDGDELYRAELRLAPGQTLAPIQVSRRSERDKLQGALGDGASLLGRRFTSQLDRLLRERGINSLAALREAGEFDASVLSADARAELQLLRQHAGLQLISRRHAANRALIAKGYTDVLEIAAQPAALFTAALRGTDAEQSAAVVHERAVQQRRILGNLGTGGRVEKANGFATQEPTPAAAPSGCGCQSAVSPLAYLTDLLDYAARHVTVDGNALTLSRLAEALGQPFADLPTDCAAAEDLVRQVRLCIEVLHDRARRADDQRVRDQVQAALDRYLPEVYDRLLLELGTSYHRLRALRTASRAAREQAAEALGVAAQDLEVLLVNPTALTEDAVERLFGLPGTARDPLSTGAKLGDRTGQIRRWRLQGVVPGRNVDGRGRLYLSLTRDGNDYRVTLFRSRERDPRSIVAAGSVAAASTRFPGTSSVALRAVNGSGLTGTIAVHYRADDRTIEIAAVPELLARRLTHLERRWLAEDWPSDADNGGSPAPLVDPDLGTDADLVKPFASNPAHRLLTARTDEVAQLGRELDGRASLAAMLSLTWAGDGAAGWLATWHGIAQDLQAGDPAVVRQRLDLLAEQHLTAERFAFLHALRQREADGQPLAAQERDQALEVLTDVRKRQRFSAWRQEEETAGLTLTPSYFCLTSTEPAPHPVGADAGRAVRLAAGAGTPEQTSDNRP